MPVVCGQEVTLPDLNNPLAVINYVEERLLQQGVKAQKNPDSKWCDFRAVVNGKKCACAIGWLIPDKEYDNSPWDYLDSVKNDKGTRMSQWPLISELRNIHNEYSPDTWPLLFASLKVKYSTAV